MKQAALPGWEIYVDGMPENTVLEIQELAEKIYRSMRTGLAFGDEVKELREKLKANPANLSREIGYNPRRIQGWEERID